MATSTSASATSRRRPPRNVRRVGHLAAATVNLVLVWLVNVAPGWRWVPFLTEDFVAVVGLINLSLMVGLTINLGLVAYDPRWLKQLGDAVSAAITVVILARLWQLFPFELGERWSAWETPLRVLLALATVGTAIAVIASLAEAARHGLDRAGRQRPGDAADGDG